MSEKDWKPLIAVITDETTGKEVRRELNTGTEAETFMHTAHWEKLGMTRIEWLRTYRIEMVAKNAK